MKAIFIVFVMLLLSILFTPVSDERLLLAGIASKDIGIAFIGLTMTLLMRTKDKK